MSDASVLFPPFAQPLPPSVCVLMTLHNRARYVGAAVRSVLTQTMSDFRLIIVDDGSTDQAPDIAEQLARDDQRSSGRDRVTVERAGAIGRFAALRRAHEIAEQLAPKALLGWVDSDDLLVDTALEETIAYLTNQPACGMVYTQHLLIDENTRLSGLGPRCLAKYSATALLLDFLTHHFRLFRPEVYKLVGGVDATYKTAGDYDFCLRVSEQARIDHLPRPLYCYRVHADSISLGRRAEQTTSAARAITAALNRRGLADRLQLVVTPSSTFELVPRTQL